MAACANCLICLSSSCRGTEGWFLVLGIVSPTTTTSSAALATGSTHRHKIMSDDAPADVSFKSNLTLIKGSLHAEAVFECAHACFNASLGHAETSAVSVALPGWGLDGRTQAEPLVLLPAGLQPFRWRCSRSLGQQ